jgi:glycine hydroxymethyltransferase
VASMMAQVIRSPDTVGEIRRRVTALTQAYQVYPREL